MLRRIAIEKIYPDLKYGEDYQVLGNKTVIWMNENQQPTESEMQKAYDAEMIERYAKRRSK